MHGRNLRLIAYPRATEVAMGLRVVGAGLGRTGTASLKVALEQLLGAPCYHMLEVFHRPDDVRFWTEAGHRRTTPDWNAFFSGYAAAVDWPPAPFWEEIAEANPDAIILLSTRDAQKWWESASQTIFVPGSGPPVPGFKEMLDALMGEHRFVKDRTNKDEVIAAFERHNANVRAKAPKHRLVEWTASDGWDPICKALDLPVPSTPFPKTNTREEFVARAKARTAQE
jgi:hypothetical protein